MNLLDIFEDCPKGTKLYSSVFGEVEFDCIKEERAEYPIRIILKTGTEVGFTPDGEIYAEYYDGECVIFPSKEQRDWSKFKFKKPKFDPKTLKPFDKVLVRDENTRCWTCALYSHKKEDKQCIYKYVTTDYNYRYCIPYNDDTKHLVGITDEAPEFYRYWED